MKLSLTSKIRVLIADDSAFMRRLLTDIVNSDDQLEVVAQARDGQDTLSKIMMFKPDVVTLDVEMPVLDGLATLERIMAANPLPVVMLSAYTSKGAKATIKALALGAVDFVAKPDGVISPGTAALSEEIISKIKIAATARINPAARGLGQEPAALDSASKLRPQVNREALKALVLIGTSTGGPKALYEVMSRFKRIDNAAILIVQHMPEGFTKSLAQRLDSGSVYKAKEAEDQEEIKAGNAYVAPGGYHMEICQGLKGLSIQLHKKPAVNGHRPSVDVLMKSAAGISLPKIGVIMTGMGTDGALGMKSLKEAGALNISESSETCVVDGMPKAARKLRVIDYDVPVYRIAEYIEKALITY